MGSDMKEGEGVKPISGKYAVKVQTYSLGLSKIRSVTKKYKMF